MHELTEVAISCLPADLPLNIEVDLSELKLGDTVHLSSLVLPKGVEIPQLKLGPDHDVAIVVARQGRVEVEETPVRSEEHTSELQSLMRISYAVFCLKKKKKHKK